jgi:hypothetical protein
MGWTFKFNNAKTKQSITRASQMKNNSNQLVGILTQEIAL